MSLSNPERTNAAFNACVRCVVLHGAKRCFHSFIVLLHAVTNQAKAYASNLPVKKSGKATTKITMSISDYEV